MALSKVVHKYLLKAFYEQTNKEKYKMQIFKHNIYHINRIAIKDVIPIARCQFSIAKKGLVIDIPDVKITRVYSTINVLLKYNWYLNLMKNKTIIDLGLQSISKYY